MADRSRTALTWVEVAVLVFVIFFLTALLLPALHSRPPSRRAECMNRQRQLSMALLSYESLHGHFPGYVNRVAKDSGGNHIAGSWVVCILPYVGRNDLYSSWQQGDRRKVLLDVMICPSDPPRPEDCSDALLSYVVNCGRPGDSDTPADGVFLNHNVDSDAVCVSLDYIGKHDGASNTLLLSENIQAGRWSDTSEADLGMVWHQQPESCSRINQFKDVGTRPQHIKYARPSANHPGGVIVSFCDGRQQFLDEGIDYRVYQHLMSPDSRTAGLPGELDENDY